MKFDVRKINRSSIYHLLNTIVPCNHRQKAEFDALGIVIIIGMIMGIVYVVRLILSGVH